MARVVDFCPSSDDELPDLHSLSTKPSQRQTKPSTSSRESPKKDLVPKSASKSVGRKVRRLESSSQISGNLLFQRCNPEDDRDLGSSLFRGSPRKTPLKRTGRGVETQTNIFANESIFEHDDLPPPSGRAHRTGRSKIIPILEDDDSEHESQPTIEIDQLLRVQQPGLRRLQSSSSNQSRNQSHRALGAETEKIDAIASASTSNDQPATTEHMSIVKNDEGASTDEPSTLHIADEDFSSGYNDSVDSDFVSQESSSQSIGSDTDANLPATHARETQSPAGKPSAYAANVLQPRDTNSSHSGPRLHLHEHQTQSAMPFALDQRRTTSEACDEKTDENQTLGLANELSKLRLENGDHADEEEQSPAKPSRTPPQTPSKPEKSKGLASPTKQVHIPKTPHRPSMDVFWNQEFVDEWNEQHSPRKLVLPSEPKSPSKSSPKKDIRKAFDSKKKDIARGFLEELDTHITEGRIAELAESTGGVKVLWSKTLNTTAGRANWRRETIRTKKADGTEVEIKHKHHASIELADKVIDDENRLLNVLAHEFCHLANFMISGVTNNPHGKEFKTWAVKCSRKFGDQGVKVTTKHSYEIAFKYVWECSECGSEYKRHSRSIDPQRHRCGSCKGTLKQTKPAPRGGGKPSEYQAFVREQMKIVKEENPGCPQKDIMKLIAAKWAQRPSGKNSPVAAVDSEERAATQTVDLTVESVA